MRYFSLLIFLLLGCTTVHITASPSEQGLELRLSNELPIVSGPYAGGKALVLDEKFGDSAKPCKGYKFFVQISERTSTTYDYICSEDLGSAQ
jgi:hypothetical protein